ncbi:xanthine dehydrogenase family protein molybdopterin-binding subunit [Acuticoccus sp.]|uniref:xanthine dehydrogenase family protein molybdopterin-binding subunit n=1 Tax=Acuticoccus sp. TaxID=1904378 RepID=UPI003B51E6C8
MTDRRGRIEDLRFITGQGRFTGDVTEPDALVAVFVRSPHAAARIVGIDATTAAQMPGVAAVLTAADLVADGVGPVQAGLKVTGPDGREWGATPRPLLGQDAVRFVGEPVAMVIAASYEAALDAAEAVEVDYDEGRAVVNVAEALADGAALVDAERPGNVGFEWAHGEWDRTQEALAASTHQVRLSTRASRVNAAAMEPRGALARPEGNRWALYASHQGPQGLRGLVANAFDVPADAVRVVAGDVGGSFGMKAGPLREEMLTFWAARRLGRPVRWTADRTEDFLADEAGRDMTMHVDLGLDADGRFTALSVACETNIGAYATGRSQPPLFNIGGVTGVYRTPSVAAKITGVLTHTAPVAAYRGAGRPEATLAIERTVDHAARKLGLDPLELRRINLIQPAEMPWSSPFIFDFDCGDFPRVMDEGLDHADIAGFPERRRESEARGKLRGLGVAMCVEAAGGPYKRTSADYANLTVGEDGTLTLHGGAFNAGQGLETALIDVAAAALGVPAERFTYVQGDTDHVPQGKGMGGSSAMISCGSAAVAAVDDLLRKARERAADALEASDVDLEYGDGAFRIVGTDRIVALSELAASAAAAGDALAGDGSFKPEEATFPNGCHVCEVEVDPDTGETTICAYSAIEDIGRVLNHQLAEGQIHGGVAQGLGQVFQEEVVYAPGDGQLLSASYMDYAVPRADDLPAIRAAFTTVETALNPLKVKGVGEAGSVGALAAGLNAVCDALASRGVETFDMPATPSRVWQALREAERSPA